MISFTKKFDDNSTDEGYLFTFYCDVSNESFQSTFIESKSDKKSDGLRISAKGISTGGGIFKSKWAKSLAGSIGFENIGNILDESKNVVSDVSGEYGQQSSEWIKERDLAFETAQNEVKKHFTHCSVCNR